MNYININNVLESIPIIIPSDGTNLLYQDTTDSRIYNRIYNKSDNDINVINANYNGMTSKANIYIIQLQIIKPDITNGPEYYKYSDVMPLNDPNTLFQANKLSNEDIITLVYSNRNSYTNFQRFAGSITPMDINNNAISIKDFKINVTMYTYQLS